MKFTKLERNQLFNAIAQTSLDPAECTLDVFLGKLIIRHDSGSTFEVSDELMPPRGGVSRGYRIDATVADSSYRDIDTKSEFSNLIPAVQAWAREIKAVAETPDFWAEIQRGRELITDIEQTDSGNTPFTEDEQRQIAAQLQEIKKQLREQFELTNEQMERIDERLDEVVEASRHMGRKDWLIYFLGTITALIITATVTAGVGQHILSMVIQGIAHLFTGGSEPSRILT